MGEKQKALHMRCLLALTSWGYWWVLLSIVLGLDGWYPCTLMERKTNLWFVIRIAIHFEGWMFAVSAHVESTMFEVTICGNGAVSLELHSHWQHAIWAWHNCAFCGWKIRWIKWIIISSASIPALKENYLQTEQLHFPNFESNNPSKIQSKC